MPDVLDVVIIFHDFDHLFHQLDVLFALQLLIVLGNHFDLSGETLEKPNFLRQFGLTAKIEFFTENTCFADVYHNSGSTFSIAH